MRGPAGGANRKRAAAGFGADGRVAAVDRGDGDGGGGERWPRGPAEITATAFRSPPPQSDGSTPKRGGATAVREISQRLESLVRYANRPTVSWRTRAVARRSQTVK